MEPTPAAPVRSGRTPRDMALSLLVLLIPVALIVGAYRVLQGGDQPVRADIAPAVAQARGADLPVLAPEGLDRDWLPLVATYQTADGQRTLRLGYLSPDEAGLQLVQSDRPADSLLAAELGAGARPGGAVEIAGRQWQRYTVRAGERALVLLAPELTVVVIGSVPQRELDAFAATLR